MKIQLTRTTISVYSFLVLANSSAEIRPSRTPKAHRRQHFNLAGFFMRTIQQCRSNYGGLDEATERLAVFFGAVGLTLFSSPPVMRLDPLGGDKITLSKEAVIMTTTPTQFMIYTFLVSRSKRPLHAIKKPRFISVFAPNEEQARARLAGMPLVFLSRTPKQGATA